MRDNALAQCERNVNDVAHNEHSAVNKELEIAMKSRSTRT
jgi:hypothetical protein